MFDPISSTSDLIPGIYEGGLKTWECSLDLAEVLVDGSFGKIKGHLLQSSNDQKDCYPKTLRIFELGCGTGVPSILLLFKIFYELLSQDPKKPQQSTEPILQIVLQDFNRDVLKLLTFPNILLSYIYAKLLLTNNQKGNSNHYEPLDPTADLEISDDLKQEFKTFLRDNRIDIRLIYGPWKALYKSLPPTLSAVSPSSQKKTVEDCNGSHDDDSDKQDEDEMVSQNGGTFDLIYSSETIYCLDSLDDLIELLIRCSKKPTQRGLLDDSCNLLVSSKVHYFGVGGGTNVFVRKIEKRNGTVKVVRSFNVESNDERSNPLSGIARIVMSIKF
ncbi:hypothetical protein PPACK8108_LOCUS24674 [Phakopsora pachyrhizi]|uniref:protein-histidine N-methyltransferase n=1 Tax=Phakopsora pachyrhizi TaxID=170000 RepID=A0AAV0BQC3_PHAPC|nr:hypothetical protein PPACK8108_LOCUS24674 [Phakopsora pachyrhizi]